MEEEKIAFGVKIPKSDNDKILEFAKSKGWTHYQAVNYLIHKGVEEKSIFKDPRIEVPDTDRQVIIMVSIYDWFVAKWDSTEELWKGIGRHKEVIFSRCYPHRWMEMQDDFYIKQN